MELDWSAQSAHIRTLYRPRQPGDGYDETTIQAAEVRLGLRLPAPLHSFYRAWGRRRDLTEQGYVLLELEDLTVGTDALIFGVGDQAMWYWGVRREALEEADPPVVFTEAGRSAWPMASGLDWTASHAHLSSFLDDLTYLSALCGGARHGGWTQPNLPDLPADQITWLETHWHKATVTPLALNREWYRSSETGPALYIRGGQALWWDARCGLAAREAAVVEEIGQRFHITWVERW